MLSDFIRTHRSDLIARTRAKVAKRLAPEPTEQVLSGGVPLFLDQIVQALDPSSRAALTEMHDSAVKHGAALLGSGYTVSEVVHDYGDVCQAVTELADERAAAVTVDEFHTLNLCLDNAIAESVTEFTRLRDESVSGNEQERMGIFAHELRNKIAAAQLAFQAIESGRVAPGGNVGRIVKRNLFGSTALINRTLIEVRLDKGKAERSCIHLQELLQEVGEDGSMVAAGYEVALHVAPLDQAVDVEGDPQILAGAIANLLQNAFKFTHKGGHVTLRASPRGRRAEIAVEDECGGLPPGMVDEMFGAFQQRSANRRGLGLGLFVSRKGIEATGGAIRVRDVPGKGCVFTIDLPVLPLAP